MLDNQPDEYDKGESVEDIIPYLLPMKCCIRTKFGDIALSEDEWDAGDNHAKQPHLFPGLMFRRCVTILTIFMEQVKPDDVEVVVFVR